MCNKTVNEKPEIDRNQPINLYCFSLDGITIAYIGFLIYPYCAKCACYYFTFAYTITTRSSATAEKQRVSCPHGGGLGPPAHSPSAPSGYTYAYGRI